MATPRRLARSPKVRQAAAEAPRDKFDRFVTALEAELQKRLDLVPADSAQCAALFDVWMAVHVAVDAAR